MRVTERADHWETLYATAAPTEVSWYQREPATSLRLIQDLAVEPSASVIDVGAGEATLVDRLLDLGFTDLTVLDLSQHALTDVRERIGERARHVSFFHQDVLTWKPDRQYDIWHDRAVFHFLTERTSRNRYVEIAALAVRVGGSLVLATFAEDGPTHCSGLPVSRYSAEELEDAYSGSFSLVAAEREEHVTPSGAVQPFTWVVLRHT